MLLVLWPQNSRTWLCWQDYCNAMGKPHTMVYSTAGSSAAETEPNADILCHCDSGYSGHDCSKQLGVHTGQDRTLEQTLTVASDSAVVASITCPDGVSSCPAGTSCAPMSTAYYGCCPTPEAVICDTAFCCPKGHVCGEKNARGNSMGCVPNVSDSSL